LKAAARGSVWDRAAILVADPDPDACLLYVSTLEVQDHQVIQAVDGRDALAKALAFPFSLVITETRVPFLDGISLCQILRRDYATQGVPILVITADARPDVLDRAIRAGADGAIVKPFAPGFVRTEAERLMRRAHDALDRSARLLSDIAAQHARSGELLEQSQNLRGLTSKAANDRFATSRPPGPPPILRCPTCDRVLAYVSSEVGGVTQAVAEQWDYYTCRSGCGRYQYRQRSRRLHSL
jgi:two-component system chemotaxis response regulator CheY